MTERPLPNWAGPYGARARAAGFDRLAVLMSFDCDTDRDADAALALDDLLAARGIAVGYAVPGTQLRRNAATYRILAGRGREFLNHGGKPHAEWRGDRYVPITFYRDMTVEEIGADMADGHQAVLEVTGRPPSGFRMPHFGCFQAPEQLAIMHAHCRALGYRLSSSTVPAYALRHGPIHDVDGVWEIPLTGTWRHPEFLLDSWSQLEDTRDYRLGRRYALLFEETLRGFLVHDLPGLFTHYVDPIHVIDQPPFLEAMDMLSRSGVPTLTFSQAADLAARAGRPAHVGLEPRCAE